MSGWRGGQAVDVAAVRQVVGVHLNGHVVAGGDPRPGGVEVGLGAGDEDDVDALGGEAFRAGDADALGCAGDECRAAAQVQVHCRSSL